MQQRTSVLPASHPVRNLMGLARQIALPHEHGPERFPSFPALERTAVMGFNFPATLQLPASTPIKMMVCRQAGYPVWADQAASGLMQSATYAYDFNAVNPATNVTLAHACLSAMGNVSRTAVSAVPGVTGATLPLSPYVIMGVDASTGPMPYIYIPGGWNYYVCVTATSTTFQSASGGSITLESWSSPGETVSLSQISVGMSIGQFSGASSAQAATTGLWLRPASVSVNFGASQNVAGTYTLTILAVAGTASFTGSGSTAGSFAVTGAAQNSLLPLAYPTEFANSRLPWYSTRTTASACLCTNVSQVLNKGGTVLAGRVAPQVMNPWAVTASYINALHPAEKAFLPLETGLYTYCPPSTDLSDFWDYTCITATPTPGVTLPDTPVYRLDNTSLVNIAYITASSVAETLAVNSDWHIEFRTSSALFPIGLSAVTLETLHQAQVSLSTVGFFFENPNHKAILSKVIAAAKKYGPAALGLVNPTAGRIAEKVVTLSRAPKSQMKTTSAAASGMIPKGTRQQKKSQHGGKKKKR